MKTVFHVFKDACIAVFLTVCVSFLLPVDAHATDKTKDTADAYAYVKDDAVHDSDYTVHDNLDGQEYIVYCYDSEKQQPPAENAVTGDDYPLYDRFDSLTTPDTLPFNPNTFAAIKAALFAGYPNDGLGFFGAAGLGGAADDDPENRDADFARLWTQAAVWYIENSNDKTSFDYLYFQNYAEHIASSERKEYVRLLKNYIDQQMGNTEPSQSVQFAAIDGRPIAFSSVADDRYETNVFTIHAFYGGSIQIPSLSDSFWAVDTASDPNTVYTSPTEEIPVSAQLKFVTTNNAQALNSIAATYKHPAVQLYYYKHIPETGSLDDTHTEFQDLVRATLADTSAEESVTVTFVPPTETVNLPTVEVKKTYQNTETSTVYPTLQFLLAKADDATQVGQATLTGGSTTASVAFTEAFKTELKEALPDASFALVLSERQDAAEGGSWIYDTHTYGVTLTKTADGWTVTYDGTEDAPIFLNSVKPKTPAPTAPTPAPTENIGPEEPAPTPTPAAVKALGGSPSTGDGFSALPCLCVIAGAALMLAAVRKKRRP